MHQQPNHRITFGALGRAIAALLLISGLLIILAGNPIAVYGQSHVMYLPLVTKQISGSISAWAIAEAGFTAVRGARANVWTAQQPNDWYVIGSPVGVCTTEPPCEGAYFETGYAKGLLTDNILRQYISYKDTSGVGVAVYDIGVLLLDENWYNFQVWYDPTTARWQAMNNGYFVYQVPTSLGFTQGAMAACGAEGGDGPVPLGVQCDNMQYLPSSYTWTSFDYTDAYAVGVGHQYCVYRISPYGAMGWGPC